MEIKQKTLNIIAAFVGGVIILIIAGFALYILFYIGFTPRANQGCLAFYAEQGCALKGMDKRETRVYFMQGGYDCIGRIGEEESTYTKYSEYKKSFNYTESEKKECTSPSIIGGRT